MSKSYYVYIMTNINNTVLYTGIINDLIRRVQHHRESDKTTFTGRYRITKLVYYEETNYVVSAIEREKQIKAGSRKKKIDLIFSINPEWKDLLEELV